MAYSISDIVATIPFGRVGWVVYTVDLGDGSGRVARVGAWVNGAYSQAPGLNADGTRRTTTGGVFDGISTQVLTLYDVKDWAFYSGDLDTDSAAMAILNSTLSDSGLLAAIATAMSGQDPGGYAISASVTNSTSSAAVGTSGISSGVSLSPPPGYGSSPQITSVVEWRSSNPAVADVTPYGDNTSANVDCLSAGTCYFRITVASVGAPGLTAVSPTFTVT